MIGDAPAAPDRSVADAVPDAGSADAIRARVLQAIADNRTPGLHFVGYFMGARWDEVSPERARMSIRTGPHCADANGEANLNVVTSLIDMALANAIRAGLSMADGMRLGTISLHIAFTGEPLVGHLEATARCEGWVHGAQTRQGIARCDLTADGRPACFASGTFMELPPPPGVTLAPLPWQPGGETPALVLTLGDLDARERRIWKSSEAALAAADERASFIQQLFAQSPMHGTGPHPEGRARCVMPLGLHAGNRVGHAQGGVTFALAALTARAAAPRSHRLVEASAWFLNPGEGRSLKAGSKLTRGGRRLSVVDTVVIGKGGTRVLEMVSTHCAISAGEHGRPTRGSIGA